MGFKIDKTEVKSRYSISIRASVMDEVRKIAEDLNLSTSQLIENLLVTGIDDYQILKKIGVIGSIKLFLAYREKVSNELSKFKKGEGLNESN